MPRLVRFHYVGRVQDDVDLKRMLMIVSCGVCQSEYCIINEEVIGPVNNNRLLKKFVLTIRVVKLSLFVKIQ